MRFHHLAQTLIPLAGCGVFLGLSALSVTLLRAEGFALQWIGFARIGLLAGAFLWSVLAWLARRRLIGGRCQTRPRNGLRRIGRRRGHCWLGPPILGVGVEEIAAFFNARLSARTFASFAEPQGDV